jgi:hypothetical protein
VRAGGEIVEALRESRLQNFGYSLDRLEPVEPDQPDPRGS